MVSSLTGEGLQTVWETMTDFRTIMSENDELAKKRADQRRKWMWSYIQHKLVDVSAARMCDGDVHLQKHASHRSFANILPSEEKLTSSKRTS